MKRHALTCLILLFVALPCPLRADDVWVGKEVLPKRGTPELTRTDESGNVVVMGKFVYFPVPVREEKGDWVKLQVFDIAGWVNKDEVVRVNEGIAYFTQRIQNNDDLSSAYTKRAWLWFLKSEHDIAIKDAEEAIRLAPSAFTYNVRGVAWAAKKEYDKAIKDYDEAIRLDAKMYPIYNNRGRAWHGKNEYDNAIKDYDEAIRLYPKYVTAYVNRGRAWNSKKQYDKAINDYDEAIRLDPKHVNAYANRGLTWYGKKDYDKAIKDYDEAIRLDPNNVAAFNVRGIAWRDKKEYKKAIMDFDEALRIDPNYLYAITNRGAALYEIKEYDTARLAHEATLKLDPKFALALHRLTWLLACCPDDKQRDGKKALRLGKTLVELENENWQYHEALAAAYAESGNFEQAVAMQQKALTMLKEEKDLDNSDVKNPQARLELYQTKKPYRDK